MKKHMDIYHLRSSPRRLLFISFGGQSKDVIESRDQNNRFDIIIYRKQRIKREREYSSYI